MWAFSQYSNNIAIISQNHQISYHELIEATDSINSIIKERCLVFCLCDNIVGSILGYISFLQNRVVPVMLSSVLDEELFNRLYKEYRPQYIWCPIYKKAPSFLPELPVIYEKYGYMLLKTPHDIIPEMYDELALLLTTSGSTGSPKFVRQSYKNIEANTRSIIEYLQLNSEERPITILPMNYTYGLSIVNTHLDVGATILLTNSSLMKREFWDFLKTYEATSISGVPYTYEMLRRLNFFRMKLPSIRTLTQAGGKLSDTLHKEFAEFAANNGIKFIVMYGQCEATARMAYLPADMSPVKIGSMGRPIPGGRFELIDTYGNLIEQADEEGELIYYGDNVTLGYAEMVQDLKKGDERHGKLYTGDIAKRDKDGYYYITGRKNRFLKIFGNRVNLDDSEKMLRNQFSDIDVAISGKDDLMVIFSTKRESLQDIRSYIAKKTGLNIKAFKVLYIDHIPHNSSGKILYGELEKHFE